MPEHSHELLPIHYFSLTYATLWPVRFQPLLDGVEELERGAAVEDAVVERDLEVHHAAYGDGVVLTRRDA